MPPTKLLVRAAARLHATWLARSNDASADEHVALTRLRNCQRALRRAVERSEKARDKKLTLILPQLRHDVLARVKGVQDAAAALRKVLEQPPRLVSSVSTWIAELQEIEEEFGGVRIDLRTKCISATTEPITLEDLRLGAFRVEFLWGRWPFSTDAACFDIVALEPNYASVDDHVAHPHVRGTKLCAGRAIMPLRKALEEGRLADAYSLIRSVLTTYNRGSAYVRLDNWSSNTECHDCGHPMRDDDARYCEGCGHDVCDDCMGVCSACDASRCFGCLQRCAVCQERCCARCLKPSAHSQRRCCAGCLQACASCTAVVATDEIAPETDRCLTCEARLEAPAEGTASGPEVPIPVTDPPFQGNHHAETVESVASPSV